MVDAMDEEQVDACLEEEFQTHTQTMSLTCGLKAATLIRLAV